MKHLFFACLLSFPFSGNSQTLPIKGCQDPACDQAAFKKMMIRVEYALYQSFNFKYNDSIALNLELSPEGIKLNQGYAWVNDEAIQYYFQTIEKNVDLSRITDTGAHQVHWLQKPPILKAIYKPMREIEQFPKPLNTPGFNEAALKACYLYYYSHFLSHRLEQLEFKDKISMELYFENGRLTAIEHWDSPQNQKIGQSFSLFVKLIEEELIDLESREIPSGNYKMRYHYSGKGGFTTDLVLKSKKPEESTAEPNSENSPDSTSKAEKPATPINFQYVEGMPTLKGSCDENAPNDEKRACFHRGLVKHISENFVYNTAIIDQEIEGAIFVNFVIERDGSISNISIIHSVHPALDIEAIRVISTLPEIAPATQKGKPVRMQFTMPIRVKVE